METCGEGSHLQAKERGLRRNQPCRHYFQHMLNLTSYSDKLFALELGSLEQCPSGHGIEQNALISSL